MKTMTTFQKGLIKKQKDNNIGLNILLYIGFLVINYCQTSSSNNKDRGDAQFKTAVTSL